MRPAIKLLIFSIISILLIVSSYFGYQWYYLNSTNDVPYRNLRDFGPGGGLIYFNLKHKGEIYPVVVRNSAMPSILSLTNPILIDLYSLYLNEVIKRDLSIDVDDDLYHELKDAIVDRDLIYYYRTRDILNDSSFIVNQYINTKYSDDHYQAIVYTLLKQGINCRINDVTGGTYIETE